jgi:hypothetical protein
VTVIELYSFVTTEFFLLGCPAYRHLKVATLGPWGKIIAHFLK